MDRISRLRELLGSQAVAWATRPTSIRYLTDFTINPGERFLALHVAPEGRPTLFLPALEADRARAGGFDFDVVPVEDDAVPATFLAPRAPKDQDLFLEKGHVTLAWADQFQSAWGAFQVKDLDPVIGRLRLAKDEAEIAAMRQAAKLIDRVIAEAKTLVRPGITEIDLARHLDRFMGQLGTAPSFATTVLFGPDAAFPHGTSGERPLERGDVVLFDIGCVHEGYASDITRTYFFLEERAPLREVYDLVFAAHEAAAATLHADVRAREVDLAARKVIEAGGHGEHFTHRVGHGLGAEVHEAPSLHGMNDDVLPEGTVVTIEPGVYLPGVGGVRIEDAYIVTANGAERLTHAPRAPEVLTGRP